MTTKKFTLNFNDLLNRKSLHIKIPINVQSKNIQNYPVYYIESHSIKKHNFHLNLFSIISKYKKFIDIHEIKSKWNKLKLFTNPFELVSYNNSYRDIQSLVDYIPLSRAYFKLQELIVEYNLLDINKKCIRYVGLAEGPGGFIECFINYRRSLIKDTSDKIFCITLRECDETSTCSDTPLSNVVPDWKKVEVFLKSKTNVKAKINLSYGKDGTGNLYKLENILYFRDLILGSGTELEKNNNKVDFVTADGGIDYSTNFNFQEQLSFRLIFCEIVSAFSVLQNGGNFVLKIFDIHTTITLQYLYLLANYFEEIIINKPYTSRPANSEKYVICRNFKGVSTEFMTKLYNIVHKWEITHNKGLFLDNLFGKIPPYFKRNIMNFTNYIGQIQIENILLTIMCRHMNKQQIDSLLRSKISNTIYWAIKYKQPINYKSNYFKAFKS